MSGSNEQPQTEALEGVIVDEGPLHYTAQEQQRLVNLTHAMVFLKKDAQLAEVCARKAHRLMRLHLRECFRALLADDRGVPDIYSDIEYVPSSEQTTRILDL